MADEQNSQEFKSAEESVNEVSPPQEQFFREKTSIFAAGQKISRIQMLKDFFLECKRVLLITKKPNKDELKVIVKISGFGILLIGFMGFLIHVIKELLIK